MPTSTYTKITSYTVPSAQGTISLTGIPSTYTDLTLIGAGGTTANDTSILVTFNNDTGANYATSLGYTNTSTSATNNYTSKTAVYFGYFAGLNSTYQWTGTLNIYQYTNSNWYKQVMIRSTSAAGSTYKGLEYGSGTWLSTSTINRIDLVANGSTFITGTIFTLYGIKAA